MMLKNESEESMLTKELAGTVIYDEQGRILLIHRNTSSLKQWELPGGKVEAGEMLEEAAIREAQEEIGVDVEVTKRIGNAHFEHVGIDWSYTWFIAVITKNQKPIVAEAHTFDDIAYWNIEDLRKKTEDISPNLINLLKVL
jgi:mutator protein MutT